MKLINKKCIKTKLKVGSVKFNVDGGGNSE